MEACRDLASPSEPRRVSIWLNEDWVGVDIALAEVVPLDGNNRAIDGNIRGGSYLVENKPCVPEDTAIHVRSAAGSAGLAGQVEIKDRLVCINHSVVFENYE